MQTSGIPAIQSAQFGRDKAAQYVQFMQLQLFPLRTYPNVQFVQTVGERHYEHSIGHKLHLVGEVVR
jgi:hypothetical protein